MTRPTTAPFRAFERRLGSLPLEMRLLLLLARGGIEPAVACRVEALLEEGPSWPELLRLTERHRLDALIARQLPRLGERIPTEYARRLAAGSRAGAALMLRRTAQLLEIMDAFRACGIPAVPYKGPALAVQLYGRIASRPAGDLDLLVRPGDVAHARRILESIGYRSRYDPDRPTRRFMLINRCQEEFLRPDGGWVELHWAFTNRDFRFDLDLDRLIPRLGTVVVGGRPLPAFHPDDLLPILCVHGAKHRWDHLEWLAGVARLLRSAPGFDWETILERTGRLGVRRTLFLGLWLARELLEAPVPDQVGDRIHRDGEVARLALEVLGLLACAPGTWEARETMRRDRFRARLRERRRDRLASLWYRATTPSDPRMWKVGSFAGRAIPIHTLQRPFRILRRLGRAAGGRGDRTMVVEDDRQPKDALPNV